MAHPLARHYPVKDTRRRQLLAGLVRVLLNAVGAGAVLGCLWLMVAGAFAL